jgi:hypothetical protein
MSILDSDGLTDKGKATESLLGKDEVVNGEDEVLFSQARSIRFELGFKWSGMECEIGNKPVDIVLGWSGEMQQLSFTGKEFSSNTTCLEI